MPPPTTATFATLSALGGRGQTRDERSARGHASQTPRRAVAGIAALLALACGGISVHHDETDPGAAETADSPVGKPPAPTPTTQDSAPPDERSLCESICARCIGAGLGQGCQTFCSNVIPEAEAAKCSVAFASLLKCRNKAVDQCALDACPTEDNALTACVLEYCDSHYQADLCVAPI